jgi:hypothetical protein
VLRLILLSLLLFGCQSKKNNLTPSDTYLKEIDWLDVYAFEMEAALIHDDPEAFHFFFYEYLMEKSRLYKKNLD